LPPPPPLPVHTRYSAVRHTVGFRHPAVACVRVCVCTYVCVCAGALPSSNARRAGSAAHKSAWGVQVCTSPCQRLPHAYMQLRRRHGCGLRLRGRGREVGGGGCGVALRSTATTQLCCVLQKQAQGKACGTPADNHVRRRTSHSGTHLNAAASGKGGRSTLQQTVFD